MGRLKDFITIIISTIISITFFSCKDVKKVNNKMDFITFKEEKKMIKVTSHDFDLERESNNNFSIKITNVKKWDSVRNMQNPKIYIAIYDSLNIVAYPVGVLNSSTNKEYFYPLGGNGKIFYDSSEKINITKKPSITE